VRSEIKKMMDYCTYCPKMCRFSCPVSEAAKTETYTPWGKMELGGWVIDRELSLSPDVAAASYQCTNCLHCQKYCEHDNDVPAALQEVRRLAVQNYTAPDEVYDLQKRFAEHNNPYGEDLLAPIRKSFPKAFSKKKKEIAFLPSCHTLKYYPERIKTYFNLFDKLGVAGVYIPDNPIQCCGAPLQALGLEDDFREIAEVQAQSLRDCPYVLTDGPECAHAMKSSYANAGFPLLSPVLLLMEFLQPYLRHQNYRSKARIKGRIAYHDPVFLARYLKVMDLPRQILEELTGFPPIDLSFSREDTLSAGGEGAYDWVFPELSRKIAARTTDEVESRGVGLLITACAKSEELFRRVAGHIEVRDLYQFLNEHILNTRKGES